MENIDASLQELYKIALEARENSYSPYSHFAVGAAVRTAEGKVYKGCNVENGSYGMTVCAERNAMFNAVCAGERNLVDLCVVADTSGPVSPCGACRQVMSEFKLQRILLGNLKGDFKLCSLEDLLPYEFKL